MICGSHRLVIDEATGGAWIEPARPGTPHAWFSDRRRYDLAAGPQASAAAPQAASVDTPARPSERGFGRLDEPYIERAIQDKDSNPLVLSDDAAARTAAKMLWGEHGRKGGQSENAIYERMRRGIKAERRRRLQNTPENPGQIQ